MSISTLSVSASPSLGDQCRCCPVTLMKNDNDYSLIEAHLESDRYSSNQLTITVVIPFYRELSLLDRTLASLALQDYPTYLWNVIIVEDGSLEDTQALVSKYCRTVNLRRVRQHRRGYRLSTARNLGIQESNSEVIILLDFDCVCLPSHVRQHVRWFEHSERVATFGLRRFVDLSELRPNDINYWITCLPNRPPVRSVSNNFKLEDKRSAELRYIKQHPFPCNCFHGCNVAFRRRDAICVGGFDADFDGYPGYEDIEFAFRLTQLGCFLVYEPDATVYHQENNAVTFSERREGRNVNLHKMFAKVPGIREFRESIGQ